MGGRDVGDGSDCTDAGARGDEEYSSELHDSEGPRTELRLSNSYGHIPSPPPYLDSDMTSRWFDFGGDTIIRTDQYIRLAADTPSQSGWVFLANTAYGYQLGD